MLTTIFMTSARVWDSRTSCGTTPKGPERRAWPRILVFARHLH